MRTYMERELEADVRRLNAEVAFYSKQLHDRDEDNSRLRAALREIADFEAPNYKWKCQIMRRKALEALGDD